MFTRKPPPKGSTAAAVGQSFAARDKADDMADRKAKIPEGSAVDRSRDRAAGVPEDDKRKKAKRPAGY